MTPAPRNLAASVTARLRERSRELGEDHQYVLMRFGLERLLYRLSKSVHAEAFVVKGAMMFLVWAGSPYRPTKDDYFREPHYFRSHICEGRRQHRGKSSQHWPPLMPQCKGEW